MESKSGNKNSNWFEEKYPENFEGDEFASYAVKISKKLFSKKSKYQQIDVFETSKFGNMLVLDGKIMFTEKNEFFYHEAIVHPALTIHQEPRRILVLGGGDGGTAREILKHNNIKKIEEIIVCDIDEEVVAVSKKFFPNVSKGFSSKKVKIINQDGKKYLESANEKFDIIIADLTDPVAFAQSLFAEDFYRLIKSKLNKGGIFVSQTESPMFFEEFFRKNLSALKSVFKEVNPYIAPMPDYPSGTWSYVFASDTYRPASVESNKISFDTKLYNFEYHKAMFALPNYLK
ncbi:MAG TPA: polyamine aminopropyltransferase [Candidatus Nanoarchaeia archaeon]|nr:polyamine aminopropyltransferase [Candidatus Nanoarchaeia archaeon]